MFVSDWMTLTVHTVGPDDSCGNAVRMMRESRIHHAPVIADGRIRGILSYNDLREHFPARADVFEMNDLLEKTKVKAVMKKTVVTTTRDMPIEEAAMIMYDRRIGCLPVMQDQQLVGIISDRDIFRALIDITGVRKSGHRISLVIEDRPRGAIKEIADIVRKHGFGIESILTSHQKVESGARNIVIRTKGNGQFGALKAELMGSYREVKFKKASS
ncbi:MAG: CBS domain-containing protein [Thermodesulfovibrionales bacterium]